MVYQGFKILANLRICSSFEVNNSGVTFFGVIESLFRKLHAIIKTNMFSVMPPVKHVLVVISLYSILLNRPVTVNFSSFVDTSTTLALCNSRSFFVFW